MQRKLRKGGGGGGGIWGGFGVKATLLSKQKDTELGFGRRTKRATGGDWGGAQIKGEQLIVAENDSLKR